MLLKGEQTTQACAMAWFRQSSFVICANGYLFNILEEMANRCYLSEVELMVMLAVMRLDDNAYGVPISRELEEIGGRELPMGSIYATLERLEEKSLISSNVGEPTPERGGRAKRYFRVTIRGLREVRKTRQALVSLWRGLPELEGGRV
jgi:DNA-binding PadR family transcriptional regulator